MFRTDGIQESLSECADKCKHNQTNLNDTAPLHHPTSHKQAEGSDQTNRMSCYTWYMSSPRQDQGQCLTCTFRASCCSSRLTWAQVPTFTSSSARDRKKGEGDEWGGGGGAACTGGYKGVQAVRPRSVAGGPFVSLFILTVF